MHGLFAFPVHRAARGFYTARLNIEKTQVTQDGTWLVTADDNGSVYEYEVDVSFTPPYAELPRIVATSIVDGMPWDALIWTLSGGSEAYFDSAYLKAELYQREPFFSSVESALLPLDAQSWAPDGDFNAGEEFSLYLTLKNIEDDLDSLVVTGVRSLTTGAPELTFGTPAVEYTSTLNAIVVAPAVPEPSTAALGALLLSVLGRRRWG